MNFNIRKVKDSDYESILLKWWKDWGWEAPPKDFLPQTGLIVSKEDQDICAGFMYLTNSKVALTEFIVSNKEYKEKDRGLAIDFLIDCIVTLADNNGCKYAHVILKNQRLLNRYKRAGYIESDTKVTEMIKVWQ
ncbi:MAG: hypothetical protein CML98_08200 [Rhodobiaceae bacterium]|nr:hypothetical protein [Rhodobiaceae bacterium]|tara:strand:- start:25450 stop:25851 length:402 start_codon:yes stop_codon:yes gene_type:complete